MFDLEKPSFMTAAVDRRDLMVRTGTLALSAAAVALLAGKDGLAAGKGSSATEQDGAILNSALGAELEAVAAYQVGAESGLLRKPVLDLAVQFQDHHKQHADALAATIRKLGATPAQPKKDYGFPVASLKSESDVLRFAAGLEKGAVSAYLGAVPIFGDRELARVAASILGDEAMHWAVLRHALGENPVPSAFVT